MTQAVTPHLTTQPIAASLSSASVQTHSQVTSPGGAGVSNQTLLSLASSGQLILSAPESSTAALAPPGQGNPPPYGGGNVNPVTTSDVATVAAVVLNGQYGGT